MTEYAVFRATPGEQWQEIARLEANGANQAIRAALATLSGTDHTLAAVPTRSWTVVSVKKVTVEKLVFGVAPQPGLSSVPDPVAA